MVIARISEPIQPIDRGERYEDPLAQILETQKLGMVSGGGSQLDEYSNIVFADIEIMLANLDEALRVTRETLNSLGVPVGSALHIERNGEIVSEPLGEAEGLIIYLDGVGLPDAVYAELDFQTLCSNLAEAFDGAGELRGLHQLNEETGLFVYGQSADEIYARMKNLVKENPILQNARLVFNRRDQNSEPKEIRLPMLA